jgi:hypothetical protein
MKRDARGKRSVSIVTGGRNNSFTQKCIRQKSVKRLNALRAMSAPFIIMLVTEG